MSLSVSPSWLDRSSPLDSFSYTHSSMPSSSLLLSLPKEILIEIISKVASILTDNGGIAPVSLIELSKTCRYLHSLIHTDNASSPTIWQRAFRVRFDTAAIRRRRIHRHFQWQLALQQRCTTLNVCRMLSLDPSPTITENVISWSIVWDMITEHDELNVDQLLKYRVEQAAGLTFQWARYRGQHLCSVVLPILSVLVNYDFSVTRFFRSEHPDQLVSPQLSYLAYNFETDALISKHMPLLRPYHIWNIPHDLMEGGLMERRSSSAAVFTSTSLSSPALPLPPSASSSSALSPFSSRVSSSSVPSRRSSVASTHDLPFYPAQDPLASAFHLFFLTIFAFHPTPYQAIPNCIPLPLFTIHSEMFDVEFLRRYERNLFFASLKESREAWEEKQYNTQMPVPQGLPNIYADTGFASPSHFVTEAHLIEGEWMGYYSFLDPDDVADPGREILEDWFDGPMRLTLRIIPLDDNSSDLNSLSNTSSWVSRWLDDLEPTDTQVPRKRRKLVAADRPDHFPSMHLRACPLTRFEGWGVDNLGIFTVSGLIDDTEDGQVTWEKTYTESGETWEYSGRFLPPMGMCGRWGDDEYGGPWWMWKVATEETLPQPATNTTLASTSSSSSTVVTTLAK
ncbi:uncharacterized protein BYT42DRAFT_586855 [Radiomyces spectabilis]|uniref:uncharacterized protein n=1 Tax=Radiomyces spectabilis TaxID=64574 RepID=UPI00222021E5|nr:uncharacterized protein BYT42DRAFT_586855 [Radiomyces spectabilis]KAI8367601.1 hypothetical protein BYT42DRAFT_586855 [Radiomyces spectabilis]